ncbi:MAG TPA: flagellar protein FlhE [Pseudomonas sp.]|uniref:flagellar protein FlhE n=1 Tax=Pseudomonas sp. TaxID=306 RepID=UPI002EDBB0A5
MKNCKNFKGVFVAVGMLSVICFASQSAVAGTYSSSVNLPTLYSKGYIYTAIVPVPVGPRHGVKIKNITWNWNVHGWPRGLQVYLCQTLTKCIDVSRRRTGSSQAFKDSHSTQPFYFELKISGAGPMPVAGLLGRLTVDW